MHCHSHTLLGIKVRLTGLKSSSSLFLPPFSDINRAFTLLLALWGLLYRLSKSITNKHYCGLCTTAGTTGT